MLERVERNDVVNAAALAGVLLGGGLLLLTMFGWLGSIIDEGLWTAEGGDEEPAAIDDDAFLNPDLRPPNEVSVRVGNGSDGRQGLAGRATRTLEDLGYGTLPPENKEGLPIDDSFVYYVDGYKLDAIQIATTLDITEAQVRPLLDNPGVQTEGADVIVVLGQNADP